MKFFIIRHSTRETPDDFEDAEEGDPEAELTEEGEQIAKSLGKYMADNDHIPSVLYASPTVRGQQTAQIIADQIDKAGYAAPDVKTDASIGPHMSIRGTVLKNLSDESAGSVGIISHRDSIRNGLQQLGKGDKPDPMAMGEMRVLKVKRKSGKWQEEKRVLPSDLDHNDSY